MKPRNDAALPDDLADIGEHLRRQRLEAGERGLDDLKMRAVRQASQASTARQKGPLMRSKIVTLALASTLVLGGSTAGVIAAKGGSKGSSAAKSQYLPGKGCGDRNHVHVGPPGNPANRDCPPPVSR
jgi:hypothetical protein